MENKAGKNFFNIKSIGAAALALLVTLIFLSKTIYNYNLPVVTAGSPVKGTLTKQELTTGIVRYEDISEVYSEKGGKISALLIKEGDTVSKGQLIVQLNFKNETDEINKQIKAYEEDLEKKLAELEISREKLHLDIEKIDSNIANIDRKISELNDEVYKQDSISDFEILQCQTDISKAEDELKIMRLLADAGAITRQEIESAEFNLENLRSKYDNLKQVYEESVEKSNENIRDKEKSREKQIRDYEYQIETYNQELKSKNFDLSASLTQEEAYRKECETKTAELMEDLDEYSKYGAVYAPDDAFVMTVAVHKGQYINVNQHLASFGLTKEYVIDCEIPLNNNFVVVGDGCYLSNSSHTLEGVVTKVTPGEGSKELIVSIPPDEVTAGETFDIKFEKVSGESYTLVPNGAVNMDSEGYFLRQIKRRDGILGKEFYTEKLRVYIGDSDSENTAIVKGIGFFEPIALLSDKSFSDGDTVKLANESDFFEN